MRRYVSIFIFLLTISFPAGAAETFVSQGPTEPQISTKWEDYVTACSRKFDFGAVNLLAGWTVLLTEPADGFKKQDSVDLRVGGLVAGLGKGLFYFPLNTAGGFLNAVTADFPQFRVPLPKDGVDIKRMTGSEI